jgi:hypothetical protein
MADKKISELTTITTVDNATDLFPIVDTSASETKKITPTALKTALSLNNVDNTSDANKPISSATQTALDLKVDENALITGATKTKITYDAKGLVTSGADLATSDLPSGIDASKLGSGLISNTEFDYLNGVTSSIQTQLDSKQTFFGFTSVAASGTLITLTSASNRSYVITGSGGQVIKLPNATTLNNGDIFYFNNNQSSGVITINNNSNTLIVSIPSGGYVEVTLLSNSIAAGSWEKHELAPSNVSWSTNTLDYAGSITSATWNGVAIADAKIVSAATWNAKQDALGFTPENVSNKSTSVTTDQASNTKYPSVKSVYDWAVGLFATITNLALKTDKLITANRQTASYTLVLSDADKLVETNVATANNVTIPLNSSVAFATGTQILLAQYGAGQTTLVPTSGVTIRSNGAKVKLNAQYSGATLIKIDTNEWYLFGDIA